MPGLNPYDICTGDYLHVDIFNTFPTVVAIVNYLVNPIRGKVFHHIPLHILLNH